MVVGGLALVSGQAQTSTPAQTGLRLRPAFASGTGPIVAVDEAHKNRQTLSSPSFRALGDMLGADGYQVRPLAEPISRASMSGIDVILISGPGGWFTPDESLTGREVATLMEWIRQGGSLLLMLDHLPEPRNARRLLSSLGITHWHNGYAMVDMPNAAPLGNIIFWRSKFFPEGAPPVGPTGSGGGTGYQGDDAVLESHAISEGRSTDERVQRVATFVGSAFRTPSGGVALLRMPLRAISLVPEETPGRLPAFTVETPRMAVGGWLQGAVMTVGQGRVAVFGESGLFSGGPAADNRQFVLNVMHWLSRLL
jgi:hypothetical protein